MSTLGVMPVEGARSCWMWGCISCRPLVSIVGVSRGGSPGQRGLIVAFMVVWGDGEEGGVGVSLLGTVAVEGAGLSLGLYLGELGRWLWLGLTWCQVWVLVHISTLCQWDSHCFQSGRSPLRSLGWGVRGVGSLGVIFTYLYTFICFS